MKYRFGMMVLNADSAEFQRLLADSHGKRTRPECLCVESGVPMYIAKIAGRFYLKRMPNTGSKHAISCDHYEMPTELSGQGVLLGSGIQEDVETGTVMLRFDFALSKNGKRNTEQGEGTEKGSVKTDGNRLSLLSLLHYLWDEAGLNRWSPAMLNKRSWGVVQKYLVIAAEKKVSKGVELSHLLYIPEVFSVDRKDEIYRRRMAKFSAVMQDGVARRLLVLVGEVKEVGVSKFGHKLVLKHLPDCPVMCSDDIYKRLMKRFATEMELWNSVESSHLIFIGTVAIGVTGVASLQEVAFMNVNESWIPFENMFEHSLIDNLVVAQRRFTRCLRYNVSRTKLVATALLTDLQQPQALFVIVPGNEADSENELKVIGNDTAYSTWVWEVEQGAMPQLPV